MKLVINPPGPDEPGYFLRQRQVGHYLEAFRTKELSASAVDDMVEFIVDFVEQPEDRDEARALILQLSENECSEVLDAINGGGGEIPFEPSSASEA